MHTSIALNHFMLPFKDCHFNSKRFSCTIIEFHANQDGGPGILDFLTKPMEDRLGFVVKIAYVPERQKNTTKGRGRAADCTVSRLHWRNRFSTTLFV